MHIHKKAPKAPMPGPGGTGSGGKTGKKAAVCLPELQLKEICLQGRAKRGIVKEIRQTGLPLGASCKNATAVVPEAEDLIRGPHKDRGAYGVDK